MAAPTLTELYGDNAVTDGVTLTITLADLVANGLDGNGTNGFAASNIAAALVRRWNASTKTKTDDSSTGLVVGDPFLSLVTRNSLLQRNYQYSCNFYVADASSDLDPDLVV